MQRKELKYTSKVKEISKTLEQLVLEMVKELRESEMRYRSIVEFAADAIVSINREKKVTSWNKGAVQIFGYSEKEALGTEIDRLIAKGEVRKQAEQLSQRVLSGESIRSLEAIRYNRAGDPRHVLVSAAPILDEQSKVEEVSLMYKDISELKLAHAQLVQTEKQATLGVIAGSIGHELNNLVGGLLVHARLLQQYYDKPEKVAEINQLFLTNLEKIALHGKNLLSLSTPTAPRFEPLDLNTVLETTTDTLILSGVLKHFGVVKKLADRLCYVYGDRNLLEQVIRNVEINAAHAMVDSGELRLETRLSDDAKHIEMIFADNGCGIPDEMMEKIFQPFFTTKSQGRGTGLGLPIVKSIIEQHKGYIEVESDIGVGTKITVGIPVVK
jgi:PAS domain S-box-containing protein